jgi:hypothetical protein
MGAEAGAQAGAQAAELIRPPQSTATVWRRMNRTTKNEIDQEALRVELLCSAGSLKVRQ